MGVSGGVMFLLCSFAVCFRGIAERFESFGIAMAPRDILHLI